MAQSPHGTICRRLRSLFRPSAIHSERRNRSTTALCLALIERSVSVWGWGGDGCGRDKFRGFEWKTSGKSMDFRNHGGVLIGNPWDFAVCFFFCHAILAFRFSSISFWDHGHPAFLRQTWCDFHLVQGVVLNDSGFSGFQNDDIVCWCRSREIKILLKIWVYAILCVILPYCSPWKRHIFAWIHPNPRFFFEQALKKNPSF